MRAWCRAVFGLAQILSILGGKAQGEVIPML
jgi:hypothetical protein